MSDLGFCAPCAAAVINPTPLLGMGLSGWKTELWNHLKPAAPWIIGAALVSGYIGWKAGNLYCSSVFLKREAALKKRRRKRKRK